MIALEYAAKVWCLEETEKDDDEVLVRVPDAFGEKKLDHIQEGF